MLRLMRARTVLRSVFKFSAKLHDYEKALEREPEDLDANYLGDLHGFLWFLPQSYDLHSGIMISVSFNSH